jgi:dethiobiotin synthase
MRKSKNESCGFFVTGTGTDVGKTFVSRLLIEGFSRFKPVSYMKPVQTGCGRSKDGTLRAPDFEYLRRSGPLIVGDVELHVPYRFVPACSPHLAAKLAHEKISIPGIARCLDGIRRLPGMRDGCVVVEGAGGIMVPLGPSVSTVHLMKRLALPVVLVTVPDLGTLNHTFLTLCAIEAAGLNLAGLVVNNRFNSPRDFIYKDNVNVLRGCVRDMPVFEPPFKAGFSRQLLGFCHELLCRSV